MAEQKLPEWEMKLRQRLVQGDRIYRLMMAWRLRCLIHRGMLIFQRKWSEPYRCLTMRSLSLMAWTECRAIPIHYGSC